MEENFRIVKCAVEHCILVLRPRKSIGNNYFAFLAPMQQSLKGNTISDGNCHVKIETSHCREIL